MTKQLSLFREGEPVGQTAFERILETHQRVVGGDSNYHTLPKYRTYALSTLRGGVGKSTLAFNTAHELAQHRSLLIADLCPQCNLTESILRDYAPPVTILDALRPVLLGPAFGEPPDSLSYRVAQYCDAFKTCKPCWFIPGNPEMFAFPSTLYQQLQIANAQAKPIAILKLLECLKGVLEAEATKVGAEGILLDTSPFYAGGTHLSWCAADALIVPVRVDEHSIESLKLTLDMLSNPSGDFVTWNQRAGRATPPKIAAIVMTMVGSKSQLRATPDRASRMYIERAVGIAENYHQLFDCDDIAEAFVITDDFVSAGRISGAKSIPISKLTIGSFHQVEGKRLQVNRSATRYQKELAYLTSVI